MAGRQKAEITKCDATRKFLQLRARCKWVKEFRS